MCKECEKRGKTWEGSDPRCAFDSSGKFKLNEAGLGDNWNCATLNTIREYMYDNDFVHWSEDNNVGVAVYDGMFLILHWYKRRGTVDEMFVVNRGFFDDEDMTDMEVCEEIIKEKIL